MTPVLATRADMYRLAINANVLAGLSNEAQDAALLATSDRVYGVLQRRHTLPLTAWGDDVRRAVCVIAAIDALVSKGWNPTSGQDALLVRRAEQAEQWLRDFAKGLVDAVGIVDSSIAPAPACSTDTGGFTVVSRRRRSGILG